MLAAILYATASLALLSLTLVTLYPKILGRELQPLSALAAMIFQWFIPQALALGILITLLAVSSGALAWPIGQAALAVHLISWTGLLRFAYVERRSLPLLDGRPVHDEDLPFPAPNEEPHPVAAPLWLPALTFQSPALLDCEPRQSVVFREVEGIRLKLDVYRPRHATGPLPGVIYVHGGGWFLGSRRQSRFMLPELARAGFVVFAVSYRFAPRFPLPAALIDAKAAVAWVRAHAAEYGALPDRIAVIGGSAGGHLSAMLALTPNDPRFQPGFEDADTRVRGAVILYGVSELTRVFEEDRHFGYGRFLERVVFRKRYRDDPELFRRVEPIAHVKKDAPPILFVHGELDGLVPIDVSRRIVAALRTAGAERVHLLEVPKAHHAFELFPTASQQRAVRVIVRFLRHVDCS